MKEAAAIVIAGLIIAASVLLANHQRIKHDLMSYSRCMERATPLRLENFEVDADKVLTDQELLDAANASKFCLSKTVVTH